MPAPVGKLSSDIYIYKLTNAISPYLCQISPNTISVVGFLFIIPIIWNIHSNRGWLELILLVFLKQFLDCLDGSVARKCNSGSNFGAKLDVLLDTISCSITGIYFIYRLFYSPKYDINIFIKLIFISIAVYSVYCCGNFLYNKIQAEKNGKDIETADLEEATLYHDNSVLVALIAYIIIKFII